MSVFLDLLSSKFLFLPVVILLVAAFAVALSKKLGLGAILGLLLTGIIIGPHTPGELIPEPYVDRIMHFSELGVVLLLFIVGLEMQPKRLWAMRKEVFGLGSMQIIFTGIILGGFFVLLGYHWKASLVIGLTLSLSSTAFVLQILQENKEVASEHGRTGFSILLMQDIAIVPLLAIVSLLSNAPEVATNEPFWLKPTMFFAAIAIVVALAKVAMPWVLNKFANSGNRTSFILFVTLAVVFSAYLMDLVELSMELGAFILGMMLSGSKYGFQIHASVESTKTVLIGIFFISVGMMIDFAALADYFWIFLLSVFVVLIVKMVLLFLVSLLFGVSKSASVKVAFLLSQGGEFGFVLFGAAFNFGIINTEMMAIGIGIISVSMAFTPSLYKLSDYLVKRFFPEGDIHFRANETVSNARIIIAGYSNMGMVLCRLFQEANIPFIVIEKNPEKVKQGKQAGVPVYFGNITDAKLLKVIGVEQAEMIIITLRKQQVIIEAIKMLKNYYPLLKTVVRAYELASADKMVAAGANLVVAEDLHNSLHVGSEALRQLGIEDDKINLLVESLHQDEIEMGQSEMSVQQIV